MLLRLIVVAVCFSFAGLSGEASSDLHSIKERAANEGSGNAPLWPGGINDDEDDPRSRSNAHVEGSGAHRDLDEDIDDTRRVSEGSGDGPPAETYPKPNRNDDNVWQTPWEPATKSDDTIRRKNGGKTATDDDFSLPGSNSNNNIDSKPAPAPGNDINSGIEPVKPVGNDVHIIGHNGNVDRPASFFAQPGILAAVIGGVVVGLLCTVLLLMYIVYRMRKMDEGSYPLEEPRKTPSNKQSQEFFA